MFLLFALVIAYSSKNDSKRITKQSLKISIATLIGCHSREKKKDRVRDRSTIIGSKKRNREVGRKTEKKRRGRQYRYIGECDWTERRGRFPSTGLLVRRVVSSVSVSLWRRT